MIGVVVAANGYPEEYEKGAVLHGLDAVSKEVFVFHAGTKKNASGEFETNGGRVLLAGAKANTLKEANKLSIKDLNIYNVMEYFTGKILDIKQLHM